MTLNNISIEKIILSFGNTLVEVNETIEGKVSLKGYYKLEGEHTNKDYILFVLKNFPKMFVICNTIEECAFCNYDDL